MVYRREDNMKRLLKISLLFIYVIHCCEAFDVSKVIYAINAGGQAHVDCLGITYNADPYNGRSKGTRGSGVVSYTIRRVPKEDNPLYQVYRYSTSSFNYTIPITDDGNYVLVLKFSETFYYSRFVREFNISFADTIVVRNLNIFDKVGFSVAHDEYIPFSIYNKTLVLHDFGSRSGIIQEEGIELKFIKGEKDNPKVNALLVYRGNVNDFPKLRPLLEEEKPDHRRGKGCDCSRVYCHSNLANCFVST